MDNQKQVQSFLRDFVLELSESSDQGLDFILLFGSVARGEWKKGVSDVDLIIQVKSQEEIEEVKKKAEDVFWRLDEKHQTQFNKVCSTKESKNVVKKALGKAKLYVPFEVFGPGDLDWERGKIKKKELAVGAKLIASQAMLFKKMKLEGKILYGRDIRKTIQIKISPWEKFKALLIPHHLAFCSIAIAPFLPKTALQIADKSIIYSVESVLFFLDKPIGKGVKRAVAEIEKDVKKGLSYDCNIFNIAELDFLLSFDYAKLLNFELAKKAIKLKYNWDQEYKKFNKWEVLKFCFMSLLFVDSMNWYAILRVDKYKMILKVLIFLRTILIFLIVWLLFYYL